MGEEVGPEAYADVWVVIPEQHANGRAGSAAAIMGEARRLADALGCYLRAVVESEIGVAWAIECGSDKAHVTADVAEYLATQRPEFVMLPAGEEALAARLAHGFGAGLLTGALGGLEIDPETRALRGRHAVYGGDYFLEIEVATAVKVV